MQTKIKEVLSTGEKDRFELAPFRTFNEFIEDHLGRLGDSVKEYDLQSKSCRIVQAHEIHGELEMTYTVIAESPCKSTTCTCGACTAYRAVQVD